MFMQTCAFMQHMKVGLIDSEHSDIVLSCYSDWLHIITLYAVHIKPFFF